MRKRIGDRLCASLALLMCALAAWGVSLIHWRSWRVFVPFFFLAIVFALGAFCGRTVGILGSITAAVVFAHFMFEPVGSFVVDDHSARSSLAWMVLAGVSLSYLLLPSSRHHHERK